MARFNSMLFAAVQLNDTHEKPLMEWASAEKMSGILAINKLLADGFKISCSWIDGQSAFCFTIIGTEATKEFQNMCMTSWSDDFEEVAIIAAFKHYVICDGERWPTASDGPRWG